MTSRASSFMPADQRKSGFTARQSSSTSPFKPYYQFILRGQDSAEQPTPTLLNPEGSRIPARISAAAMAESED
ncbi:hypothetical protein PLEOSDRAFT_1076195 [Pleurotus ostreatus PC15]|uniref:Uncharacterized protein n=1 Tax=Pleurotus ostreatus (strain PC15) TaxID=1137138 RepID=A0A067NNG9_PLEO1|nr:hypothetical protein PLEOSDRAFT_1076195 [Pleurotus ostreatus PC15]